MTLLNVDSGELHHCDCQKPKRESHDEPSASPPQPEQGEGTSLLATGLNHLSRLFRSRP